MFLIDSFHFLTVAKLLVFLFGMILLLRDMVDSSPVVAMKSLKVSDFQGMSSNLCSIFFLEISY
jgi:hypothetical protein